MASSYKFLAEPDVSLKCMICIEVASDPKQHGVCGKLFCSGCLEKHGNKPCPNCRAEDPQYFPDGKSLREIKALLVRCYHGCTWEGTVGILDNHVSTCGFTPISCPNNCQHGGEGLHVMRKDLNNHLNAICPNRTYNCVYCQLKGTFASITEEHDSVCIKKAVSCPNDKCTLTMERGLTKKHVETVCSYTVVACKYASIGCSMEKMRMDMKEHEKDDKSHFPMALEKIMILESKIVKLEDITSSQIASISSLEDITSMLKKHLETLNREKSITFNLSGYGKKKEGSGIFHSEPFYTSPGGYKMEIQVHPNAITIGKGTHMSVYSQLLEGPNDDNLPWPFLGTVTFYLLNQLSDDHHHSMELAMTTTHNARVHHGRGFPKFLSHTKLSQEQQDSNIQYLMEDTLYFRVTVEVDHHKPWLDCTHPTPLGTTSPANLTPK